MGKRTGLPRGRPPAAKNTYTKEREARLHQAAAVVEELLPAPFQGDAHTLLMIVYKDTTLELPMRLDAAKAAIPYEKPRLNAVQHSADKDGAFAYAILTAVPQPDDETMGANDDGISATSH